MRGASLRRHALPRLRARCKSVYTSLRRRQPRLLRYFARKWTAIYRTATTRHSARAAASAVRALARPPRPEFRDHGSGPESCLRKAHYAAAPRGAGSCRRRRRRHPGHQERPARPAPVTFDPPLQQQQQCARRRGDGTNYADVPRCPADQ